MRDGNFSRRLRGLRRLGTKRKSFLFFVLIRNLRLKFPARIKVPYSAGPRRIPNSRRQSFLLPVVAVVFLIVAAFQSISFYVDSLWFESLGYESVYWYRLRTQALVFVVVAIATTGSLWILFRLLIPKFGTVRRPFVEVGGETISIPPLELVKPLAPALAVLLGFLFGILYSSDWSRYALFFNQPATPGVTDPVFDKPLSFYFFTLPVLEAGAGWLLAIALIGLAAAAIFTAMEMESRLKGLSLAFSLVLVALAVQTYVGRFAMLRASHSLFTGVRYVDDSVIIPGRWFVIFALLAGAVFAAINIRSGRVRNLILAAAAPVLAYAVVGVIVPAYVSTFVVRPNEFVRETPYITRNIDYTRRAYALDRVERIPFEPRVTNAVFDPVAHAPTLDNIRLWDWRALQSTLRQIQEIRTYYEFQDVDIDRYMIDGKPMQMMLATRELSLNKLPAGSRNWVNERLIYTHGYGVTMNPVSRFTNEGLPEFRALEHARGKHPARESGHAAGNLFRRTDQLAGVREDRQKEFNYRKEMRTTTSHMKVQAGFGWGRFLRRLLLAWTVGDLTRVPFSDDITADSALLMRRDIRDRVSTLAPFLIFDDDPYMVVGDDGALYWIMDAFTDIQSLPVLAGPQRGRAAVNYIRNSVKVVIDAYNGTVRFYVFDREDPMIQAYQKMFPAMFLAARSTCLIFCDSTFGIPNCCSRSRP